MLLSEFVVSPEGAIHERVPDDEVCGRILIFGLEGEMFFASGVSLEEHLDTIEKRVTAETRVVVLRMKRAQNPDAVGMSLLEASIDRIRARGAVVLLCGVRKGFHACMKRCGLAARLGEENVFLEQAVRQTSTLLAVRHAYELVTDPCPACPRREAEVRERGMYYVP